MGVMVGHFLVRTDKAAEIPHHVIDKPRAEDDAEHPGDAMFEVGLWGLRRRGHCCWGCLGVVVLVKGSGGMGSPERE
jgi:hypothetical protein